MQFTLLVVPPLLGASPVYQFNSVYQLRSYAILFVFRQYEVDGGEGWQSIAPDLNAQLEREYKAGRLYTEGQITAVTDEAVSVGLDGEHKVEGDLLTGMYLTFSSSREDFRCRRKGPRHAVKGDEKYCSEMQRAADKYELKFKEETKARKAKMAEANKGKDLQGIR